MPVDWLRWITFGHVESDECGAMNEFLAVAPQAQIAHGAGGCQVSLDQMADRPPRPLADGETITLGRMRVRHLDTPHVPHAWEARVLFEETTQTLLCGDLFTHLGDGPALTETDILGPSEQAEDLFAYSSLSPTTPKTIDRLAGYSAHGCRWAGLVWPGVAQQVGQRRRGEFSASSNACRDKIGRAHV